IAEEADLYVLSDEAYSDFVLNQSDFISLGRFDLQKRRTIICNSMSKNFGMSGWRVGYVIASAPLIDQILKVNQHLVTCPATVLCEYLERHFDDILEITKPQIEALLRKRHKLAQHMDSIGLKYLPGSATFYFFV